MTFLGQEELITNYTINDNLPNQAIFDCTQDKLGNMWFATEGGVVKYDGTEWTLIDTLDKSNKALSISSIKKDENGNIWAFPNQSNKFYVYDYKKWQCELKLDIENRFIHSSIIDSYISKEDTVIALTVSASKEILMDSISTLFDIAVYINGQMHYLSYFRENKIRIFDFIVTSEALFLATSRGLFDFKWSDVEQKDYQNLSVQFSGNILSVDLENHPEKNQGKNYSFITMNKLIDNQNQKNILLFDNFNITYAETSENYFFLTSLESEYYFFGTKFNAYIFNRVVNKLTHINESNGFTTTGATNAFVDKEKNVWITTQRGINKIRHNPFSSYSETDGLFESEVTSIEKFKNGPIILAHNQGITISEEFEFTKKQLPGNKITTNFPRILNMHYDNEQDIMWFNSQTVGIGYITRNGNIKWVFNKRANEGRTFLSLYLNNDNRLFFADGDGIFELVGKNEKSIFIQPNLNVRRIQKFNDSKLILGTRKGVGLLSIINNNLELFSSKNNLYEDVYSFHKLSENFWLVGTASGLALFDGKSLKPFDEVKIDKPVYFIGEENDYLWFGMLGGVLRWNQLTGEQRMFSTAEGLIGAETNRDAFLFSDNKVYIGTDRGLSVFIPEIYDKTVYESKPNITNVKIQDDENNFYSLTEKISLPFFYNNLTLEYRSPSFINEKLNRFVIHVMNLDENIEENYETQNTSYTIRNISPGKYKVGVNSINAYGVSSDTLYSEQIIIDEPFYRETWFYLILLGISVGMTLILYDYINRNKYSRSLESEVARRTKQLKLSEKNIRDLTQKLITAQEMERQRIARDLHDNVAQDLAILNIELNKAKEKSKFLNNEKINLFSSKLKSLTKIIKDVSFDLHPDSLKQTGLINSIKALCADFTNLTNIQMEFYSQLSEQINLNEDVQTNIYRFIQEALNNIRKHSKAKSGIVIMSVQNNELHIRIEDDGIGFDREVATQKSNKSMGLKSMEERILLIDGKLKIKSLPGEGTKIFAIIPLPDSDYSTSATNSFHTSGS